MRRFQVTPLFFLSLWPKPRLFKTGAGVAPKTNYLHAENKANQKSDYVIDFSLSHVSTVCTFLYTQNVEHVTSSLQNVLRNLQEVHYSLSLSFSLSLTHTHTLGQGNFQFPHTCKHAVLPQLF